MSEISGQWLRSNRRVAGSDPDGNDREYGPWHLNSDPHGYVHTYCGKQFKNLFYMERKTGAQPEGRVCGDCLTQFGKGRAKAYRR